MNRSTLIIVTAGFIFALLAAITVQMISGKKGTPSADAAPTLTVLIATKDIKVGEQLNAKNMAWVKWPESSQFAGLVIREGSKKPEEALKGRVRRSVSKGEPLLSSVVIEDTKSSFIAGSLTPGKRAVTMSITAQTGLAGFINPGDNVDVLLTYDVKMAHTGSDNIKRNAALVVNKFASETILENLRVLAADQDTKKTEAKLGKTITLEATPAQAETLMVATKMGTVSLVLRPLGDDKPAHPAVSGRVPEVTTDIRVSGVMREILKGENKAGSTTQVVRLYSGSRVDNIDVRPYK